MIAGVQVLPLARHADGRGWFIEVARQGRLPSPSVQTNVSFSRQGVIRGLHYHERGQCDLFACLAGMVRVVVLDRQTDEVFSVDIGDDNRAAVWVPGHHAHGFQALRDALVCYHVTREYDPADPDERGLAWDDPRVKHVWSAMAPILSDRDAAEAERAAP
ncbi:MAG: dTDP-4-dehydrorhamnose 3,5-epimerase family protein [Actinomycetia bacterium]|nr:dTDP-4-dehydrorhamnose 3,5-epimerase family protein [Actinomycetes bacterium]